MKFTYKSINYTVTSLNGFSIHNDTKFVLVRGSDGTKRISEYSKVKPFIFDIYRLNKTQNNQKE